ncbi:MAG: imidazole glycerol phosphate synthase subunit HisF [Gemmatimonadota bacterium]
MLAKRLIACLDVSSGRVVKGRRFVDLRDVGDPPELAARYESEGIDEIVFLDISATVTGRETTFDTVSRTAGALFVPLAVGGGISSLSDFNRALRAGADKVCVNTAAIERPALIDEAALEFGSQCVVASIDAAATHTGWCVRTHGGRRAVNIDAVEWARVCAERGAGEIILTSIDCDGARSGYDIELTRAVARVVDIPVVASGGAGLPDHVPEVLHAGAEAALVAGILHDQVVTVTVIKEAMANAGFEIRRTAA